jgi:hypothetical protein
MDNNHWQQYHHPERSSQTKSKLLILFGTRLYIIYFFNFCLVRLFHGTSSENARSISIFGWRLSNSGRLGPGIYFTVQDAASAIARYRGHEDNGSVIEVEIDVGHMKALEGYQDDFNGAWYSQGYHTCKTLHPAWCGVPEFPEWCVRDLSRVRIISIR